jgi:DNA polymerase-3 subunit alpha
VAEDLADQIETFGRYGFVKAHSAAYSLISYHTAWLKAHYPAEFMSAMLSAVLDKTDDVVKYIAECREITRHLPELEQGIEVLPPDVNESGWKFTAVGDHQIRFGLGAVRGVGNAAVGSILAARADGGRFKSLFDFLQRIDTRALNKRACEALIAAGALDAYGRRAPLLAALDVAYQEVQARQAELESGQESLFGAASAVQRKDPVLPEVPEWDEIERLAREKEALGFFISGHPLDRFREVVRAFDRVNTQTIKEHAGEKIELACVVTSVARQISRRDASEWGKVVVEDFFGTATVLAFKDAWQTAKETLQQDAVVLIRGLVSNRERDEDDRPVFLDDVELLEALPASGRLAVQIELEFGEELPAETFAKARTVLARHPGPAPVELALGNGGGARFRSRTLKADATNGTLEELQEVFGRNRVRLVKVGESGQPQ